MSTDRLDLSTLGASHQSERLTLLADRVQRLEGQLIEIKNDRHADLQRLNELWLAAIRAGWRLHPEEVTPPHTLPRHYTGPDAQLIDVPPIELPDRHEQHEQKAGPPT